MSTTWYLDKQYLRMSPSPTFGDYATIVINYVYYRNDGSYLQTPTQLDYTLYGAMSENGPWTILKTGTATFFSTSTDTRIESSVLFEQSKLPQPYNYVKAACSLTSQTGYIDGPYETTNSIKRSTLITEPTPPSLTATPIGGNREASLVLSGGTIDKRDTLENYRVEVFASTDYNGQYTDSGTGWNYSSLGTYAANLNSFAGKWVKFQVSVKTAFSGGYIKSSSFTTAFRVNSPPSVPTQLLPPAGVAHYNPNKAYVRLQAGNDPDGTSQKYTIVCNGSKKEDLTINGSASFYLTGQTYSAATVDSAGSASTALNGTISVTAPPWGLGNRVVEDDAVLAAHLTQLRTAANQLRQYYGLAAATFTDPTIIAGSTPIRAVHLTELQAAVSDMFAVNTFETAPTWENVAVNGRIKASHFNQLRDAMERL